jgi:quinol monooxygenase YgiN
MILRLVKMEFRPEEVANFVALFERFRPEIANQPGCVSVCLLRDQQQPARFFTHSYWTSHEALEAYRHSATFAAVWPLTKALFASRPEAWSLELESGALPSVIKPN